MKKFLPIIVAIVILGGAGVFLLIQSGKKDNSGQNPTAASANDTKKFSPPQACNIFTLEDAKKVLGDTAQKSEVNAPTASSDMIEVTQCFYEQPAGDTIDSIRAQKQASILVRGAKNQAGAESNDTVFKGANKPEGVQDVTGYGDGAFWNPQFGQFNVLKNGNWYILTVGPITPTEKKLEDAKALADILISKL